MQYIVDEASKKKHFKYYKKAKIKKKPFSYTMALFFFCLPVIIATTIIVIADNGNIGANLSFFLLMLILTSIICIPFGLVFYKEFNNGIGIPEKGRINETVILYKEYLEHTYEYKNTLHTFRIKYNTILSTEKNANIPFFEIDSPFFKEILRSKTGNEQSKTYIGCIHRLPLYFRDVDTMTHMIAQYGQECCRSSKIKILIDNGYLTEKEALEDGWTLEEIYAEKQ